MSWERDVPGWEHKALRRKSTAGHSNGPSAQPEKDWPSSMLGSVPPTGSHRDPPLSALGRGEAQVGIAE